jgi:TRAP-type C4-dicarboxylate transport system permease small subunit
MDLPSLQRMLAALRNGLRRGRERLRLLRQTMAPLRQRLRVKAAPSLVALERRRRAARGGLARLALRSRSHWRALGERTRPARARLRLALVRARGEVRTRLPERLGWPQRDAPPPRRVRRLAELWHAAECWVAVAAFGFIATILLLDVIGRELVGPLLRLLGLDPGATGIFAAQKLSIFALVVGSFAGVGIATATGSHIVPRFAYGWVPAAWGPAMDRLARVLTGLFLVAVAWFGFAFVASSFATDLRAPVLDWPVWPIQLAIPLGFLSAAGRYFLYAAWPALEPAPPEFQE